jgi:hypothetical protein
MKSNFTIGEKALIASPLILVAVGGFVWQLTRTPSNSSSKQHLAEKPKKDKAIKIEVERVGYFEFSPDGKRLAAFVTDRPTRMVAPPNDAAAHNGATSSNEANPQNHVSAQQGAGFIYDLESETKITDVEMPASLLNTTVQGYRFVPPIWSSDGRAIVASTEANSHFISGNMAPIKVIIWDSQTGKVKGDHKSPFMRG